MILFLENIFRFIVLILIQVFLLDNIQFLGYATPMIYILFILALPARFNRNLTLLLAFVLGIVIDMFSNTMGMHAFATVFMALFRTPVIRIFVTLDEGISPTPSFRTFGVSTYIKYVVSLVLIHHITLFIVESFTFLQFYILIYKILISSAITILTIICIQSFNKK